VNKCSVAVRTSAPRLAVTTPVQDCVHQSEQMRVVDMFQRVVWCCSSALGCKADAGPVHYAGGEQLDVLHIDSPLHEWTSCWLQATTPLEPSNCHTDLADRTGRDANLDLRSWQNPNCLGCASRLSRHCMTTGMTRGELLYMSRFAVKHAPSIQRCLLHFQMWLPFTRIVFAFANLNTCVNSCFAIPFSNIEIHM